MEQRYYKTAQLEFPFLLEVSIIKTSDLPRNMMYVEGINRSPQHYYTFLGGRAEILEWNTKGNKINSADNVFQMLEMYGYSDNSDKCKKPRTIVLVNLISPRIDYESYGKSRIDLSPFVDDVANTLFKICSETRAAHYYKRDTVLGLLTALLVSRLKDIEKDPYIAYTDRWTQSTVYYRLRPILIARNIRAQRTYITNKIRYVCEKKLGKTRAQLGIIAADRAQLFFRGRWHDVGLDEIDKLVQLGTDMLIIEKEGVAEVLSPFADKMGIALLNTRGFLTEYATTLSELSEKNGCNVAILTDCDVSGLLLAKKVSINRIGIDFDTLSYLGLTSKEVEESYDPGNNHLMALQRLSTDDPKLSELVYYTKRGKRIEIDSVLAKVGNGRFWNFILVPRQNILMTDVIV